MQKDPQAERPLLKSYEFEDQLAYLVRLADAVTQSHTQLDFALANAEYNHQHDSESGRYDGSYERGRRRQHNRYRTAALEGS